MYVGRHVHRRACVVRPWPRALLLLSRPLSTPAYALPTSSARPRRSGTWRLSRSRSLGRGPLLHRRLSLSVARSETVSAATVTQDVPESPWSQDAEQGQQQQNAGVTAPVAPERFLMQLPRLDTDESFELPDWHKHGPRLEMEKAQEQSRERERLRIRSRSTHHRHPVEWNDILDMVRHFTPRYDGSGQLPSATPNAEDSQLPAGQVDPTSQELLTASDGDIRDAWAKKSEPQAAASEDPKQLSNKVKYFFDEVAPQYPSIVELWMINGSVPFLVNHAEIEYARSILLRMQRYDLAPDENTYNIFFERAAADQHMNAMQRYLKMMVKAGIPPNFETWTTLLASAPSSLDKVRVLRAMQSKGLLNHPEASHKILPKIVKHGLASCLDRGQELDQYLVALRALFGEAWSSHSTVNGLLDTLAARGLFEEAFQLLYSLQQRHGYEPTVVQLNVLLMHHEYTHELARAVHSCVRFDRLFRPRMANSFALNTLFRLGFNSKAFNVAKVVWQYACQHGRDRSVMERKMLHSLRTTLRNAKFNTTSISWGSRAAVVVCNVTGDPARGPATDTKNIHAEACRWYDEQRSLARAATRKQSFPSLLETAWRQDEAWRTEGLKRQMPLDSLVRMAIRPSFVARRGARRRVPGRHALAQSNTVGSCTER